VDSKPQILAAPNRRQRSLSLSGLPPLAIVELASQETKKRFTEFFTVPIRNKNTREAYFRAVREFLNWCDRAGFQALEDVEPMTVAAYIEQHPGSTTTIKQHMAGIRMFFSWMVEKGVLAMNPAREVQTQRFSRTIGKTRALSQDQVRKLLDNINPLGGVVALRDRALIGVLAYMFPRISAVMSLDVKDYFHEDRRSFIRFKEKGGKEKELPVPHKLQEYLDSYIEAAQLADSTETPLFRASSGGRGSHLTSRRLNRFRAANMLQRRLEAAGSDGNYSPHSLRATGITRFLEEGGSLEVAQRIAGHADSRTTKLYDRRNEQVLLEDLERIRY
jgi:integrase/recombinase XerD